MRTKKQYNTTKEYAKEHPNVQLTSHNVAEAIYSAIYNKELTIEDWEYIKKKIDSQVYLSKPIDKITNNKFIRWLLGY